MVFVIHWHESAMDLHVFPIPIHLPTSLSTWSLWVFQVYNFKVSLIVKMKMIYYWIQRPIDIRTSEGIEESTSVVRNCPKKSSVENGITFGITNVHYGITYVHMYIHMYNGITKLALQCQCSFYFNPIIPNSPRNSTEICFASAFFMSLVLVSHTYLEAYLNHMGSVYSIYHLSNYLH